MRAQEIITELTDSSFKWKPKGRDYVFKNSKGNEYEVRFDGRTRRIDNIKTQSEISIVFVMLPKKKSTPGIGWKTGVGDAFKTFSTVKQIVQHHFARINLSKIDLVYFQEMSSEPSRMSLYDRFVPEVLKILGPGWEYESEEPGPYHKIYRFRNTQKVHQ